MVYLVTEESGEEDFYELKIHKIFSTRRLAIKYIEAIQPQKEYYEDTRQLWYLYKWNNNYSQYKNWTKTENKFYSIKAFKIDEGEVTDE